MQIVYFGDNLHEMSKSVFWEKEEKYFDMLPAENFTQSAKHYRFCARFYQRVKLIIILNKTVIVSTILE